MTMNTTTKRMMMGDKILILSPHTDDGEFGCGATIARLVREGYEVHYAAFSIAEDSVPEPFPKDILIKEVKEATAALGIRPTRLKILRYPVRRFDQHRQNILEDLVRMNKKIDPDVVFMPSVNDIHQDHAIVAAEGLRAFKKKTILCYELPWNNLNFTNTCFSVVDKWDVDTKSVAMSRYESQAHKGYARPEFIKGLAITRGTQIGVDFAEVFEVLRLVI